MDILSSLLVALARLCHIWLLSPQKLYPPCPKHQNSSNLLWQFLSPSQETQEMWPFPCAILGPQGLSDAMSFLSWLETLTQPLLIKCCHAKYGIMYFKEMCCLLKSAKWVSSCRLLWDSPNPSEEVDSPRGWLGMVLGEGTGPLPKDLRASDLTFSLCYLSPFPSPDHLYVLWNRKE